MDLYTRQSTTENKMMRLIVQVIDLETLDSESFDFVMSESPKEPPSTPVPLFPLEGEYLKIISNLSEEIRKLINNHFFSL